MNEISPINFFKYYQTTLNFKFVDVRDPFEFEKYHVWGSVNIPSYLLLDRPNLYLNTKYHYFILCKNGIKSKQVSEYLLSKGYQVTNIIGGLDSWPGNFISSDFFA